MISDKTDDYKNEEKARVRGLWSIHVFGLGTTKLLGQADAPGTRRRGWFEIKCYTS